MKFIQSKYISSTIYLLKLMIALSLVTAPLSMSHASMIFDNSSPMTHETTDVSSHMGAEKVSAEKTYSEADHGLETHTEEHSDACSFAFCTAALTVESADHTNQRITAIFAHSKIKSLKLSEWDAPQRPPKS